MSKVFKVTATMDFGFHIFIRAKNEEEAMEKAGEIDGMGDWWVKSDDGHDWTMEQAWEANKNEYKEEDVFIEDSDEQLGKQIYSGAFLNKEVDTEK